MSSSSNSFTWRAKDKTMDPGHGALFTCRQQPDATNKPSLMHRSPPFLTWVPLDDEKTNGHTVHQNDGFVRPSPGDDLSPPNAVKARRMNGVALPVSTSAGWSTSPPQQTGVYPTGIDYKIQLLTTATNQDTLQVSAAWEYTNPRFADGESMMVKVAIAKTYVCEEQQTTLELVSTRFSEYLPKENRWVNITADVDYTETAQEVVNAVLQDATANQTAGMATIKPETIELTLGPFSAKARLELRFQAQGPLYSYDAMSVRPDARDIGSQRLLPLWIQLPFCPLDHEAGLSQVTVSLQAPLGTTTLSMDGCRAAYTHLKQQDAMKSTTVLAVPELTPSHSCSTPGFDFQFDSLPPRSCGILAWLSLPNAPEGDAGFDFVHIGRSLENLDDQGQKAQVTVQTPTMEDLPNLQVPLPGYSPMGSLWRIKVKTPKAQPRTQPHLVLHVTLSDKSGSTMRNVGSGTTMRQRFNQLAEARFLKRLQSIPALVQAGVLRMDDVLAEVFLPFDSRAPKDAVRTVMYQVSDVHDRVELFLQGIRSDTNNDATTTLSNLVDYVRALRGVTPGGATDFSVGPRTLLNEYQSLWRQASLYLGSRIEVCTFVEFDTDGGHNRSSTYLHDLKSFCDAFSVRNGVVTGFGSWLNQDCASKVARTLGSVPALLSLEVPEPGTEGLDKVFRRAFSAWLSAIQKPPSLTLKVSAGHVNFSTPASTSRTANAMEILSLRCLADDPRTQPRFGAPDISSEDHTKAVIQGIPADKEILLYVVSRLQNSSDLARRLEVVCSTTSSDAGPSKGNVWTEAEVQSGSFLAYDWLKTFTSDSNTKRLVKAPLMGTSLASRLEDEVSFRFNLASPSGKTSYVGRSKTMARSSIDSAHQPKVPEAPLSAKSAPTATASKTAAHQRRRLHVSAFAPDTPQFLSLSAGSSSRAMTGGGRGGNVVRHSQQSNIASVLTSAARGTRPLSYRMQSHDLCRDDATPVSYCGAAPASLSCRSRAAQSSAPAPPVPGIATWMDALAVPVGSKTPLPRQDYDELTRALVQISHCKQRLLGETDVHFVCDVCNRSLGKYEDRYHCYHCQDFDACQTCRKRHQIPFHYVGLIAPAQSSATKTNHVSVDEGEDRLVSSLLGPQRGDTADAGTFPLVEPPKMDRTVVWCRDRLVRFLKAFLHWWPIVRRTCTFADRLSADLDDGVAQQIRECLQQQQGCDPCVVPVSLTSTVGLILDSLAREDGDLANQMVDKV